MEQNQNNYQILIDSTPLKLNDSCNIIDKLVYYKDGHLTDKIGIKQIAIKNKNKIMTNENESFLAYVKTVRGVRQNDYLSTSPFLGRLMKTSSIDGSIPPDAIGQALSTDLSLMGEVYAIFFKS